VFDISTPFRQNSHVFERAAEENPDGHDVHKLLASESLYVPGKQSVQVAIDVVSDDINRPVGHLILQLKHSGHATSAVILVISSVSTEHFS
tara:strand:- start:112 stop:384 length:273 start_codon:yes stop_codon:yes gene_type:complete